MIQIIIHHLHIVSYFSSSSSSSSSVTRRKNESIRNNDAAALAAAAEAETENESLKVLSLFCDTAMMVAQELLGKDNNIPVVVVDPIITKLLLLLPEHQEQTSPLYLASKRNMPPLMF